MSKSKDNRLKAYRGQLKKVDLKLTTLKAERSEVDREITNYTLKKNNYEAKIKDLEDSMKDPIVSDHAIVRYLERVLEMDMDCLKEEILKEDEHICKRAGNTITTVISNKKEK